ncbi:hypothetical protein SCUP515_13371, partial [Seiridium cupressi]
PDAGGPPAPPGSATRPGTAAPPPPASESNQAPTHVTASIDYSTPDLAHATVIPFPE